MRDSNYKSISNNRAAVTITTSLYDRRALDVTSDKPLVNSLNHLTYLVSSSAKVRETLSVDGGIERLIEVLHECHNQTFRSHDNIFNSEKKILTAWKWTLAFQCLVLIGTRGTESIRQRVVKAGMLPIIATVLDNYLMLHERAFFQANRRCCDEPDQLTPPPSQEPAEPDAMRYLAQLDSFPAALDQQPFFSHAHSHALTADDYDNLSIAELFKLVRVADDHTHASNDVRRRYLIVTIIKKLRQEKESDFLDDRFSNDADYDMDNNLQFLSDMLLQDGPQVVKMNNLRVAPRTFTETGVVIPGDDDIVWSLQLLAYISKYPYLKDILQNTHLVIDMSIRDKKLKLFIEKQVKAQFRKNLALLKTRVHIKPKTRKSKAKAEACNATAGAGVGLGFSASASNSPQMLNGINTLQDDNLILEQDKLELCEADDGEADETLRVTGGPAADEVVVEQAEDSDPESDSLSDSGSDQFNDGPYFNNFSSCAQNKLSQLYDSILDCESIVDDIERELALFNLNTQIDYYIAAECKKLTLAITKRRLEQKQYLKLKWNYDTYDNFDIDNEFNATAYNDDATKKDPDYDDALIEYKKVNLFPMVEKFTFLAGTDMYYWSGVIMRNSCRRNEFRGGVRQCGNLECGKWESYPREFSKCRKCKRTKYCSRECQMRAWHGHRNWCIPSTSSSGTGTASVNTDAGEPIATNTGHSNVPLSAAGPTPTNRDGDDQQQSNVN